VGTLTTGSHTINSRNLFIIVAWRPATDWPVCAALKEEMVRLDDSHSSGKEVAVLEGFEVGDP
jgi:hypothetical protein